MPTRRRDGADGQRRGRHLLVPAHVPRSSGEITPVTFSRDAVLITSYQNDAIRTTVRAPPVDGVPALGREGIRSLFVLKEG